MSPGIKIDALVLRIVLSSHLDIRTQARSLEEAERTNGSTLNHVADCKSLYRLVLWCTSRAIGASNGLDVSSSLLIATAVVDVLVLGFEVPDFGVGDVLGCSLFDHGYDFLIKCEYD